jgi:pyruvate dehydrogenase (quinone)
MPADRLEPHLGRRHRITFGAIGDVKLTVEALLPRITPRTNRRFLDECLDRYARAVAHADRRAKVGRSGVIHPQYLAALISKYAAEDAIFTGDAGSPTVWLLRHVQANGRRRTIISLTRGTQVRLSSTCSPTEWSW